MGMESASFMVMDISRSWVHAPAKPGTRIRCEVPARRERTGLAHVANGNRVVMTNKKTNENSIEPPEVDNERVARRAARAKNPEPLDANAPAGLMATDADVHGRRDPIHDAD